MINDWPTFEQVTRAYRLCRIGKLASIHQTRFEAQLGKNLVELHRDLVIEKYQPSPIVCFVVSRPKPREIFAAHFRDRIVHHLVVNHLTSIWEKKFIYSSFACRTGKGTHGALKYFQKSVRKMSRGGIELVYVLQLDIASFFVTIDRPTLCRLLTADLQNDSLIRLVKTLYLADGRKNAILKGSKEMFRLIPREKSWFSQGPSQGIPIGNLISQFGANVYLTELDHYVHRTLKPGGYLRYMDDLMLLDTDPERLRPLGQVIDRWLKTHRKQSLNPTKSLLSRLDQGINYLGYHCVQSQSPKQPLQLFLNPKKKWEWIQELNCLESTDFSAFQRPHPLSLSLESSTVKIALSRVNSRLGFLKHAKTYRLRRDSIHKAIHNTSEGGHLPVELGGTWSPLKARRDYGAIHRRK